MPVTLGVRWQGKTQSISLADDASAADLQDAIAQHCGVARNRQQLKGGYPPKPLDLAGGAASKLADLGLRHRDSLVLQEVEGLPEAPLAAGAGATGAASPPPTPSPAFACTPLAPDAVEDLERLVIPADNSCLFGAIIAALKLGEKLKPTDLRAAVRAKILADPSALDVECQADSGKGSLEYAEWIAKPDSWGGFIDMHILSGHLGVQICAVCIRTSRVQKFPEEATGEARIFLLYDGIHYDCIVASGKGSGVFSTKDDLTLSKSVCVAMELQEQKQFTDTANFTLQCQHCFTLLKGEADAQKHAKDTGHFNFQEAH